MSLREHILNAIRSLNANRTRTFISSLGIIIGVSSVIILLAFGQGTQNSITSSINSLGTNLLTITPGGAKNSSTLTSKNLRSSTNVLTKQDSDILSRITTVAAVSPQINGSRQVIYGSNNTTTTIYGTVPDYQTVHNTTVDYGRFITDDDVTQGTKIAAIGPDVVTNLFGGQDPLGAQIRIGNTFFTVVGVMKAKWGNGFTNSDSIIYIPLTTAQNRIFGNKYLSQIAVSVKTSDDIDTTKDAINSYFYKKFAISDPNEANFQIQNSADTLATITSVIGTLKLFLGAIAAISLLVWGIGVMNIMLVTVSERTKEIGIRRSIGALNGDILLQFLTESILLTGIWGIIWLLFSFAVVTIINAVQTSVAAAITTSTVLMSVGFAVGTGVIFGLLPAYKATKLKPIDALRSE